MLLVAAAQGLPATGQGVASGTTNGVAPAGDEAQLSFAQASSSTSTSGRAPKAFAAAAAAPAAQSGINTFPATGGAGDPWGTAIDGAGNVWFAEPGCDFAPTCSASTPPGQIGELNAS